MNFKPVNTCLASDFRVDLPELHKAKQYLAENYNSKYTTASHVTLLLIPYPEASFHKVLPEIENYLSKLRPFKIKLSELTCDSKRNFFYVEIDEKDIKPIHENLLLLACKYRDSEIREKDLKRIEEGKFSDAEKANLEKYGFAFSGNLFKCHLTIGNAEIEGVDVLKIEKELKEILNPILSSEYVVKDVNVVFHTDAPKQSVMVELWKKSYSLTE